jgi:acetyl esterase/lipase
MKKIKILSFYLLCLLSSCNNDAPIKGDTAYMKAWKAFKTDLSIKGKAPQGGSQLQDQGTIHSMTYDSDGRKLFALLETKNIETGKRKPVLVFLHGGFALGYSDVTDCQVFTDAGFIVMSPSYRGENQNEGNYELLMGEVADAKEAIRWVAKQPFADTTQIYTFGHSIGGAMSLNLSFHNDIPVKMGGSSAGLYPMIAENFSPPFKNNTSKEDIENVLTNVKTNNSEVSLRLAFYTLDQLVRKHYLYVGTDDNFDLVHEIITQKYNGVPPNLEIIEKSGDHFSSLAPAMSSYLTYIQASLIK